MTLQRQKEILISIFVVLYSALFFLGFRLLLGGLNGWSVSATIIMALGAWLWCALMVSATAFVTNRTGMNIIVAVVPPLLLILFSLFSLASLIGALIVFFILLGMQKKMNGELNSRVSLKVIPVFYYPTRLAIFALLVAIITLSFPVLIQSFTNDRVAIPSQTVAFILRPFEPVIANMVPGYKTEATISQIIDAQIANQGLGSVPPELIAPQKASAIQQFGKQFGVALTGRETLSDIVAAWVNRYIQQIVSQNKFIAAGAVMAIAFLAVRAIVPIIAWPALLLIRLFLYIAQRIGLITLLKTQVTVERISL